MQTLGRIAILCAVAIAAGCTSPDGVSEFNDPYEARNRKVHDGNKAADRAIVKPVSKAYGAVVPKPVRKGVENFSDNLSLPGMVVNDLLQVRLGDALANTGRFVINSTFGLGGLLDVATEMELPERETDFGETLHVWGFPEGAYVELPLLGPSTERDAVGKVVDYAANPLRFVLTSPESDIVTGAKVGARIGDRYDHSDLVDSILYDSADSYAQTRLLYLQNRRFELGDESEPEYFDPYEDPYAE